MVRKMSSSKWKRDKKKWLADETVDNVSREYKILNYVCIIRWKQAKYE